MDRSQYIESIEEALVDVNRIKLQLQKNATQVRDVFRYMFIVHFVT